MKAVQDPSVFKVAVSLLDSNNTHIAHFVQTLALWLTAYLIVQCATANSKHSKYWLFCVSTRKKMHSPFI